MMQGKKAFLVILLFAVTNFSLLHTQSISGASNTFRYMSDEAVDGDETPSSFAVVAGLAFPVGRFSSSDVASSGFARLGYSVGLQYNQSLGSKITWVSDLFLVRNRVDGHALLFPAGLPADQKVSARGWNTYWVLSGLQWSTPLTQKLSFFIASQVGLLVGTQPLVTAGDNDETVLLNGESSSDFGYRISAGLLTTQSICFSVRYEFGQLSYSTSSSSLLQVQSRSISLIQIAAGFSL